MTTNDLNNIIIREAEKLGKTRWSSIDEYEEFALDITIKELNKLGVVEQPFYIWLDKSSAVVRLVHPDTSRRPIILGVIYGEHTDDYQGGNKLKRYMLYPISKSPNEQHVPLEGILLDKMDVLNEGILDSMIHKYRKERLAYHAKHLMELYNIDIIDSSQIHKFIALSYQDMEDAMNYIEEHSGDIPESTLNYLRQVFKAYHKKKKPNTQEGLRNDS